MVHENDVLSFPVRYELVKRLVKGCDSWANKLDNAEPSHRTWSKTVEERLNFRIGRNTKRRSFVCFRHSPKLEFRSEQESTVFTIAVTIQNGIADARRARLNSKLHGVSSQVRRLSHFSMKFYFSWSFLSLHRSNTERSVQHDQDVQYECCSIVR